MRILLVYGNPDLIGGSERAMHMTARALRENGHTVHLLHGLATTPNAADDYAGLLGSPLLFDRGSKFPPRGLGTALRLVKEYISENRIDIIHTHGFPRTTCLRKLARLRPTVVTVHVPMCPNGARYLWKNRRPCDRKIGMTCLIPGFFSDGCGHLGNSVRQSLMGFIRGMLEDRWLRKAVAECHAVVVPSAWMRRRLALDGIPQERIHVVHNAFVDPGMPAPLARGDSAVILFCGRLVDFKGPDHLLQASARLRIPHRLWFVGDGPQRGRLEELAREYGVAANSTFFGDVAAAKVQECYTQSSLVVVPSLWQDNFPNVGPEAMLAGRPIVAYRVGGIPEWLNDEVTGHLVEVGNVEQLAAKIEELLCDSATSARMGEAARRAALRWSPEAHVRKMKAIYRKCCESFAHMFPPVCDRCMGSAKSVRH